MSQTPTSERLLAEFLRRVAAGLITFTDRACLLNAWPALADTLTFDSLAAGTLITERETGGGITCDYVLCTNLDVINTASHSQ